MSHRNAPLTERGRLRLARCVVEDGWPMRRAAERFQVSPATAVRWAGRYRQTGGRGWRAGPAAAHGASLQVRNPADGGPNILVQMPAT
jgi:transposase